ncbi:MAG: DUF4870 domain-containing protein [Clostridia bacterium]|nr:DUF4870 domain-containing protein [Clostridia bacterium]
MADINNVMNTPDTTAEYTQEDINNNKIMAVLAYLGILVLIPIFAAKDSKFARFHSNQGLVLLIVGIIASIAGGILALIPYVGWLFSAVISIGIFVLAILGIVNAVQGKAKELPIIGKFKILK